MKNYEEKKRAVREMRGAREGRRACFFEGICLFSRSGDQNKEFVCKVNEASRGRANEQRLGGGANEVMSRQVCEVYMKRPLRN